MSLDAEIDESELRAFAVLVRRYRREPNDFVLRCRLTPDNAPQFIVVTYTPTGVWIVYIVGGKRSWLSLLELDLKRRAFRRKPDRPRGRAGALPAAARGEMRRLLLGPLGLSNRRRR
jgi:hypothetical protein